MGDHLLGKEQSFQEALQFLWLQRFTGTVHLFFRNGSPAFIEYGTPTRVPLTIPPLRPPSTKVLDNDPGEAATLPRE